MTQNRTITTPKDLVVLNDYWHKLQEDPYAYSFYQVLRFIDARSPLLKPIGRNSLPKHEPLRMRQEPSMSFAPSNLSKVERRPGRPPTISILGFGLFGPNGPLPLHITEYVHERIHHHKDHTLSAFADIFHHRLITLFYRAWANSQTTISLDRDDSAFSRHVASLISMGVESLLERDEIYDHLKFYFAGHLVRQSRNPEGLVLILKSFFGIDVALKEFIPQWIEIHPEHQIQLGQTPLALGQDTILGSRIRDVQHKFRLALGPLKLDEYRRFFPKGQKSKELVSWVRQYIGIELAWDVQLLLDKDEVQGIRLGQTGSLGLESFLGNRSPERGHFDELIVDYEARQRQDKIRQATKTGESGLSDTKLEPLPI
ncbi:MAG: type VI secretion system baseplate subunit TssG [Alcaligenaceae bacterium]|nr:type VI secretion system baseplate subunit TssG [Alcaligenaceae bacterium]